MRRRSHPPASHRLSGLIHASGRIADADARVRPFASCEPIQDTRAPDTRASADPQTVGKKPSGRLRSLELRFKTRLASLALGLIGCGSDWNLDIPDSNRDVSDTRDQETGSDADSDTRLEADRETGREDSSSDSANQAEIRIDSGNEDAFMPIDMVPDPEGGLDSAVDAPGPVDSHVPADSPGPAEGGVDSTADTPGPVDVPISVDVPRPTDAPVPVDSLIPVDSGNWWNPAWSNCREISIGPSPADYSIQVFLSSPGFDFSHARPDLGDLRFHEGRCGSIPPTSVSLPAWAETIDPVRGSRVWFKTRSPNVPIVSLFYGNPAATGIFSADSTFARMYAFNGGGLDTRAWISFGTNSVSGGRLSLIGMRSYILSLDGFTTGFALEAKASFSGTSSVGFNDARIGFGNSFTTHNVFADWVYDSDVASLSGPGRRYEQQYGGMTMAGMPSPYQDAVFGIGRNAASTTFSADYTTVQSDVITGSPTDSLHILIGVYNSGVSLRLDWVRVRRYIEPEPSVRIGNEQRH